MLNTRIVARMDVKNNALVKGIHLEGLRVLGSPSEFAEHYYKSGIDELIYMDVVASLYGRNGLVELVKETAKKIFVPLTVGGGIRNLQDVEELLSSGADKICINTAAVKSPQLIETIANKYGSSTVVVAVEAIFSEGSYKVFIDNGREATGLLVADWVRKVQDCGAGEILLTSVDREGTGRGFDIELIQNVCSLVNVPVVAHGGAGKVDDFIQVMKSANVSAVCAASIFHYETIKKINTSSENILGNKTFLKSNEGKKNIVSTSIEELKTLLKNNDLSVR